MGVRSGNKEKDRREGGGREEGIEIHQGRGRDLRGDERVEEIME